MNWIEEIKSLRGPGQSDAGLATSLGVSKQFLSDVLAGKKELSLRLKLVVWKQLGRELDRDAALALLPDKVSQELLDFHREQLKAGQEPAQLTPRGEFDDWTKDLIALRDARGMTDAELAADLGVSGPYLSNVLNGKVQLSWKKKIAVWGRRKYDLSRDTLLSFLPAETATELIALDRARGRRRASKLAAAARPKTSS
jgi:transcriptional regulator with XRE-family HTH domain